MLGKVTIVVGGQFGSEAKGKVISFLANEIDIAVRTGAPNAGHTVIKDDKVYKLQQIPSTFLNLNCILCIGAGAIIDPGILQKEVELTNTKNRLFIDFQAGIIGKQHPLQEDNLVRNIGSTGTGSGAALIDRIWRDKFKLAKDILKDFQLKDVAEIVNKGINEGKNILIEGTQGFGLSLYYGAYPFVTSRDTTAANFLAEVGISPMVVTDIILAIRTFPIRVAGNSGPLPYEITWEDLSKHIGKNIEERTTVTNNIRRVAKIDLEIIKRAIMVNRPTQIALQFLNYLFPQDENKNDWNTLTQEAKQYIEGLERELGVPITLIGTSKNPEGMIDRRNFNSK